MGYRTDADNKLDKVRKLVRTALTELASVVYGSVEGVEAYKPEFRETLRDAANKLYEIHRDLD